MKCPVCKETSLTMAERSGIEIDYCPECRGVWLDRGELDKLLERAGRTEDRRAEAAAGGPRHGHHPYRKKSMLREIFDFD